MRKATTSSTMEPARGASFPAAPTAQVSSPAVSAMKLRIMCLMGIDAPSVIPKRACSSREGDAGTALWTTASVVSMPQSVLNVMRRTITT